jgi:hypothetical protein
MAQSQVYNAAKDAIELHSLLKAIGDDTGIPGWVASYITLSADYLETVKDYLKYEVDSQNHLSETTSASGVASIPMPGAGTLFGGKFQQRDNPFRKPARKAKKK